MSMRFSVSERRQGEPTSRGVVRLTSRILGMFSVTAMGCAAGEARQMTADDLTQLSRIAAPTVSSDGRWLVWEQREPDVKANRARFDLWRLDLTGKARMPVRLAAEPDVDERDPQIVGDLVYFSANRSGENAIWVVPLGGGTPRRVTDFKAASTVSRCRPPGTAWPYGGIDSLVLPRLRL
jgi:Tol biopolymer transport system component